LIFVLENWEVLNSLDVCGWQIIA